MHVMYLKTIAIFSLLMVMPCAAQTIDWNGGTLNLAAPGGQYGRITRLANGELLLSGQNSMAMWGPTYVWHSADDGATWGSRVTAAVCEYGNAAAPETLVLDNGNVLLFYNNRPSEDGQGDPYTIMVTMSTDNGYTWSAPTTIYTADDYFENGCWEPAAVQLDNGEIQLFFSNENLFRTNDDQDISMVTSTDGGLNWSIAQRVSYRPGDRDGMPVPLILDNGRLVMAIEDSGLSPPGYKLAIVDPETGERWNANSPALAYGTNVGGPYLRQFPTGETVLSCQLNETPETIRRQVVFVGDSDAKNFTNASEPFTAFMDEGQKGLWNSVFIKNAYTVTAVSPTTINGQFGLWTIDGYLSQPGISYYYDATPNVSGIELSAGNGTWSTETKAWAQHIGSSEGRARWVWGEGGNPGNAYFVADGTSAITISGAVETNSVTFYGTGYVLIGSELTLMSEGRITSTVCGSGMPVIAAPLGGNVGLTKTGPGDLIVGGNNVYTGSTVISEGGLWVYGSLPANSEVHVQSGAMLGGSGTLAGNVTADNDSNITPGISNALSGYVGCLTIGGNLDLSAGANITWKLSNLSETNPGANFSQIIVGGDLILGAGSLLTLDFSMLDESLHPDHDTPASFWYRDHSWKIIDVGGSAYGSIDTLANDIGEMGIFSISVDANNDLLLRYESSAVAGDANGDGRVDGSDVTILAGNWQVMSSATWDMGDFNGDGRVDGSDVTILAGNWQYGVATTMASIPEPNIMLLIFSMLGGPLIWRRRKA